MTAAVNADMVPGSPCREVRLPKVEREEMRFLNPAEVARLADLITPATGRWSWWPPTEGCASGSWPEAWVFTADKGGVLRPSNFRVKVWLPAIRAAGLAPLRPHDLWMPREQEWCFACSGPDDYRLEVNDGTTSGPEGG
jgi:hypothetical protein